MHVDTTHTCIHIHPYIDLIMPVETAPVCVCVRVCVVRVCVRVCVCMCVCV